MSDKVIDYTDIPDPIGLAPPLVPVVLPKPVSLPPPPPPLSAPVVVIVVVVVGDGNNM